MKKQREWTVGQRWERGIPHDPRSVAIYKSVAEIDYEQCGDSFCFKSGGGSDGSRGGAVTFRCPAAVAISRLTDNRRRFFGEFVQMAKDPLFERYSGDSYMSLVDSGRLGRLADEYVSRRLAEVTR